MDDLYPGWDGLPRIEAQLDRPAAPAGRGRGRAATGAGTGRPGSTPRRCTSEPRPCLVLEGVGSGARGLRRPVHAAGLGRGAARPAAGAAWSATARRSRRTGRSGPATRPTLFERERTRSGPTSTVARGQAAVGASASGRAVGWSSASSRRGSRPARRRPSAPVGFSESTSRPAGRSPRRGSGAARSSAAGWPGPGGGGSGVVPTLATYASRDTGGLLDRRRTRWSGRTPRWRPSRRAASRLSAGRWLREPVHPLLPHLGAPRAPRGVLGEGPVVRLADLLVVDALPRREGRRRPGPRAPSPGALVARSATITKLHVSGAGRGRAKRAASTSAWSSVPLSRSTGRSEVPARPTARRRARAPAPPSAGPAGADAGAGGRGARCRPRATRTRPSAGARGISSECRRAAVALDQEPVARRVDHRVLEQLEDVLEVLVLLGAVDLLRRRQQLDDRRRVGRGRPAGCSRPRRERRTARGTAPGTWLSACPPRVTRWARATRRIAAAGYEAVVVDAGGGLRYADPRGRPAARRVRRAARSSPAAAARCWCRGPTGCATAPTPSPARAAAARRSPSPSRHNASHGLVRWCRLAGARGRRRRGDHGLPAGRARAATPGPSTSPWRTPSSAAGLEVTVSATNRSDSPAPFAAGIAPLPRRRLPGSTTPPSPSLPPPASWSTTACCPAGTEPAGDARLPAGAADRRPGSWTTPSPTSSAPTGSPSYGWRERPTVHGPSSCGWTSRGRGCRSSPATAPAGRRPRVARRWSRCPRRPTPSTPAPTSPSSSPGRPGRAAGACAQASSASAGLRGDRRRGAPGSARRARSPSEPWTPISETVVPSQTSRVPQGAPRRSDTRSPATTRSGACGSR